MKLKLIDDWKKAWKFASVQLAFVVAIVSGLLTQYQNLLLSLLGMIPAAWRPVAAVVVFVLVFLAPTLSRVIEKCQTDDAANKPAA